MRAVLEPGEDLPRIAPFADQDSGRLVPLTEATALLIHPARAPARVPGDVVAYLPLHS